MGSLIQEWRINIYRGALIVRTPGTNRVKNSQISILLFLMTIVVILLTDAKIRELNVSYKLKWNDHINVVMNKARNVCTAYLNSNARAWELLS
jgi:hypothetical protein